MKKSIFVALTAFFLLFAANSAKATISGTLLPAIADSISWDYAGLQTNVSGSSGAYSHYYKWRVVGDTAWSLRSTTPHIGSPLKKRLDFMTAGDSLEVCSVLVDGSYTFVTNIIRFRMKSLPHAAYISDARCLSTPLVTTGMFNYDVDVVTSFFVYYQGYDYRSDTITVGPGTGTASVHMTSPNVPGTTYSSNHIYAMSSMGVPDTFVPFFSYTVPAWISPDVVSIAIGIVTQDSFTFSATFTKGNAATATVTIEDLDSTGATVLTRSMVISSDTTPTWTRLGIPNGRYGERIMISSPGGTDATFFYERLLQVPAPEILSADTVNATTTSTNLTIRVKTNGRSYWPGSDATFWLKYSDRDGNAFTIAPFPAIITGSPDVVTITVVGLSNLKLNPNINYAMGYFRNMAGLIDSFVISFVVKPPHAAVPISPGWYPAAASPTTITITSLNAGPSADPYNVYYFVNARGSGLVDTFLKRPAQVGFTDYMKTDSIGGRTGGTEWEIRPATQNIDNVWFIGSMQVITTMPAAMPGYYISNAYIATDTSLSYKVMGCMNGTPSYLNMYVYKADDLITPVYTRAWGYQGADNFSVSGFAYPLDPCGDYIIKAEVHNGSHGDALMEEQSASTRCPDSVATGIDQISIIGNSPVGEITVYSIDGRAVFTEYCPENQATIHMDGLAPGTYMIRWKNTAKKFVKLIQ